MTVDSNSKGVHPDLHHCVQRAASLYKEACKANHAGAAYNLGLCYEHLGQRKLAAQFYYKAARQGYPGAQVRLGVGLYCFLSCSTTVFCVL